MIFCKHNKLVFFGDSLTKMSVIHNSPNLAQRYKLDYSGSYVDILLQKILIHYPHLEIEAYNKGIGGNTLWDLLQRVNEDVLALEPDWVILFIGQNDAKTDTPEVYQKNLHRLLSILKEKNIRVVQLSTTPAGTNNPEKDCILEKYDHVIQQLCFEFGNLYIDLKSSFESLMKYNEIAEYPISLFSRGPHMTFLGNMLISDIVFEKISNTVI